MPIAPVALVASLALILSAVTAVAQGTDPAVSPAKAAPSQAVAAAAAAPAASASTTAAPPAAAQVATRVFADIAFHPRLEAQAGVRSLNESRLAAEVAATIVELPVLVGEVIARGAVVARLEARDYELGVARAQAALDAVRARLNLADTQLGRSRELARQKFISAEALNQRETEVEVVRADLKVAEAQLASARRNLEKTVLRAPFRAIVKERTGQLGELAQPGTPLVVLIDADRIEVAAAVQAKDAAALRSASSVQFVGLAGRLPVRLLRLSPAVDRDSRTIEARLAFVDRRAAPGAEGRIAWRDPQPHLPAEYTVRREGVLGVFVVEAGRARFVALPAAQEGRPVPVELAPDARVVTEGFRALADGQAVIAR